MFSILKENKDFMNIFNKELVFNGLTPDSKSINPDIIFLGIINVLKNNIIDFKHNR
jgi:hypothetical protein